MFLTSLPLHDIEICDTDDIDSIALATDKVRKIERFCNDVILAIQSYKECIELEKAYLEEEEAKLVLDPTYEIKLYPSEEVVATYMLAITNLTSYGVNDADKSLVELFGTEEEPLELPSREEFLTYFTRNIQPYFDEVKVAFQVHANLVSTMQSLKDNLDQVAYLIEVDKVEEQADGRLIKPIEFKQLASLLLGLTRNKDKVSSIASIRTLATEIETELERIALEAEESTTTIGIQADMKSRKSESTSLKASFTSMVIVYSERWITDKVIDETIRLKSDIASLLIPN